MCEHSDKAVEFEGSSRLLNCSETGNGSGMVAAKRLVSSVIVFL